MQGPGTDGSVVAMKPGNAGGAKGPDTPAEGIGQPAMGGESDGDTSPPNSECLGRPPRSRGRNRRRGRLCLSRFPNGQAAGRCLGKQLEISHTVAKAFGRWALGFMEKSTSNLLRFAHKTVLSKDAVEFARLQIEFIDIAARLCAEESAKLGQIIMSAATREAGVIGFKDQGRGRHPPPELPRRAVVHARRRARLPLRRRHTAGRRHPRAVACADRFRGEASAVPIRRRIRCLSCAHLAAGAS
jgi:hypothetical protein